MQKTKTARPFIGVIHLDSDLHAVASFDTLKEAKAWAEAIVMGYVGRGAKVQRWSREEVKTVGRSVYLLAEKAPREAGASIYSAD